jgi:hypothetical protein
VFAEKGAAVTYENAMVTKYTLVDFVAVPFSFLILYIIAEDAV